MTDASLKAKGKQDTAQTLQAHTKAFFSSCPTGTDLIIKGKHGGLRGYGGFSETGLREQTQF